MKITEVKIIAATTDGSTMEYNTVVPDEVFQQIMCSIIGWDKRWNTTLETLQEYQKAVEELSKQKKD